MLANLLIEGTVSSHEDTQSLLITQSFQISGKKPLNPKKSD